MLNEKGGLVAAIADFRAIDHFKLSDGGNDKFKDTVMSTKTMVMPPFSIFISFYPDTFKFIYFFSLFTRSLRFLMPTFPLKPCPRLAIFWHVHLILV